MSATILPATDPLTPETFKPLLKKLAQAPAAFDAADATVAVEHLVTFPLGCTEAQVGAFLTALTLSGRDQDALVVAACAKVLRRYAVQVQVDVPAGERVVDIVGTGGDGHDTFNVSTSAGIVAAGAGAIVCKHGNRASTSTSGSADLLLSLECPLTFPPASLSQILTPASPFAFLFASLYHPAFGALAPIRKQLPFRTIFNVLGPLVNPARPGGMVLGVFKPALGPVFAEALRELGTARALVVCGHEGLDEISPSGDTWAWSLEDGVITPLTLHPTRDFGLPTHALSTVRGLSSTHNADLLTSLITPGAPTAPPSAVAPGSTAEAITDFVLLNTAAVLVVAGKAADWKAGVALARASMADGGALRALQAFRDRAGAAVGSLVAGV